MEKSEVEPNRLNFLLDKIGRNESYLELDQLLRYTPNLAFDIERVADQSLKDLLKQFDQLDAQEVKHLVELMHIKSPEVGLIFVYLGPEKLKHCIPELLVYLQDINWPAAIYVGELLRKMPSDILMPELIQVFDKNHDDFIWMRWICREVVIGLNKQDLYTLKNRLLEFCFNIYSDDFFEPVKALIPVLSLEEFNQLFQHLNEKFVDYPYGLLDAEELKKLYQEYQLANS